MMVMNLYEFERYYLQNKKAIQQEIYNQADIDTNGDSAYWKAMSDEIEKHPIGIQRKRGLIGCLAF